MAAGRCGHGRINDTQCLPALRGMPVPEKRSSRFLGREGARGTCLPHEIAWGNRGKAESLPIAHSKTLYFSAWTLSVISK